MFTEGDVAWRELQSPPSSLETKEVGTSMRPQMGTAQSLHWSWYYGRIQTREAVNS